MGGRERLVWIDIARGVSITLVVLWHGLPQPTTPSLELFHRANELLVFLRMPLFFFLAGLLAARSVSLPLSEFLSGKIARFLWLFVLWSAISFVTIDLVRDLAVERVTPDVWRLGRIFVEPPLTLWFIYALAITYLIARALRPAPFWVGLVLLGTAYLWSVSSGDWRVTIPLHDRVARLAVFFFLGLFALQYMERIVPRLARAWPALLVAYVIGAVSTDVLSLRAWGVVTFACSALGILFVVCAAHRIGDTAAGRALRFCGENSLHIYVMHRIPLVYLEGMLGYLGVQPRIWVTLLIWGVAVGLPLAVKPLLYRAGLQALFELPFRQRKSDRLAVA